MRFKRVEPELREVCNRTCQRQERTHLSHTTIRSNVVVSNVHDGSFSLSFAEQNDVVRCRNETAGSVDSVGV